MVRVFWVDLLPGTSCMKYVQSVYEETFDYALPWRIILYGPVVTCEQKNPLKSVSDDYVCYLGWFARQIILYGRLV